MNATTELKKSPSGASDMAHIVLTFDNNRFASALYGQFDENLARIEQKLGVDIRSRGNQLTIKGSATAAEQALEGQAVTPERIARAADLAVEAARPISDQRGSADFRRHLVRVLTRRTLTTALARASA